MPQIVLSPNRKGDSPFKSPSAYQLRALVLDYLCHYCYAGTVEAFIKDSTVKELDADGEEVLAGMEGEPWSLGQGKETSESLLKQVGQRREIRELILAGDVETAIGKLNEYFPSVLSSEAPSSSLSGSAPPPSSAPSTSSSSLGLRLDTRGPPNSNTQTPAHDAEAYTYTSNTTVTSSHLLLNLKIQSFIEACRTRPLEIPPPQMTAWSRRVLSAPKDAGSDVMDVDGCELATPPQAEPHPTTFSPEPTPSVSASTSKASMETFDEKKVAGLISRGRKLWALANALPQFKTRDTYRKELENVGGLLAYKVPEESPVAKYLSYERREATADQVNRAILYRTGHAPTPMIEVVARQTTAVWQEAKEKGIRPRPGAVLPPSLGTRTPSGPGIKQEEEVPLFDLKQFLESKP